MASQPNEPAGLALVSSSAGQITYIDPRRAALAADPFEPQSMEELYKFAGVVSGTEFCPKDFRGKPDACFVAMVYGKSLGVGALQSIQNIAVINGRPSIWGDLFWALITSHPDFVDAQEDVDDTRAEIVLTRRNRSPKRAAFSMKDAEVAGLATKSGPWTQYPKGQMMWRARHIAASALFADALKGIAPREVTQDYIEGEIVQRDPPPAAQQLSSAAATQKPEAAAKGDQPKPAEDPFVTPEQVKEWNAARKAAGWSTDDAKMYLDSINVKRSGEMRVSQLAAAMAWTGNRPQPEEQAANPTSAAAQQEPAKTAADPDASSAPASSLPPEGQCKKWLVDLGYDLFQQNQIIGEATRDGVTDWGRVAMKLEPELKRQGLL